MSSDIGNRLRNFKFEKFIICICISWIFLMTTCVSSQENFRPNGRFGKREDPLQTKYKTTIFQAGGRFGRSESRAVKNSDFDSKFIVPRVDRLYFGSRYGKRSELDQSRAERFERTVRMIVDRVTRSLLMDPRFFRKDENWSSCYLLGHC